MPKEKKSSSKEQAWIDSKKRYKLSDKQIQMARELGLNPKKFGKLANYKQEPWKIPLPEYIEELYFKHLKKDTIKNSYDSSWDDEDDEDAYEKKEAEWEKRNWLAWLKKHLSFPFKVRREEEDDSFFDEDTQNKSFSFGHTMEVLGIEDEDDLAGIIIKVKEGQQIGYIPLCDVEVKQKTDKNFWPVREYVVWFANQ